MSKTDKRIAKSLISECEVCHKIIGQHSVRELGECNARLDLLRKAAPDMYEALIQAMRTIQTHGIKETDPRYLKIRQALAKAEGGVK